MSTDAHRSYDVSTGGQYGGAGTGKHAPADAACFGPCPRGLPSAISRDDQSGRPADRQPDRLADRQTDRQANRQAYSQTESRQADRQTDRHTHREAVRMTDLQLNFMLRYETTSRIDQIATRTDTQALRQTDGQIDRHTD